MTVFEEEAAYQEETGPVLEFPEEPTTLKAALRGALLDGRNWRDGLEDELCIGLWLWERWHETLQAEGLGRQEFYDALVTNRRELWLWLIGERRWHQFIEAQAGRILRRLPASTDPGKPPAG